MIRLARTDGPSAVKVTFTVPADNRRRRVTVVGDFNDWDPSATPMRRRGRVYSASVILDANRRYAFRYRDADENWFDDDTVTSFEDNGFGGVNAIIDLTGRP